MLDALDPFRRRSVALALYRMLTGHQYDLCVVNEAVRAAGLDVDRGAVAALRLHHCQRYSAMPEGFHAQLASQTLSLFAGRPVLGDGFLKDLATTAGLRPEDAPAIGLLVPLPSLEGEATAEA
ncbi:hypothetical protein [Rubricoccus marinus]|uniref:Uncharacterized protein n=1 Tax=Rubricoccus marinus TaxID=716817 RepID=A0A259TUH5_9BACT|nr:hypothetical protein [Rubricoccus marinus]OZC01381.1 hypothetical protein BSZ36_16975 [Rubricoccus marinus]